MNKLTFSDRLQLEDIKDLVENIIIYPNRFIIEELLKFKDVFKKIINKKDISDLHKKYYCNIIDNPELLNEDSTPTIKDNLPEFIDNEDIDNNIFSKLITLPQPSLTENDKKLINMDYPNYPCINKALINKNFYMLANKIAYY